MSLDLTRAFPPTWLGHPPHMSDKDFALWRRFRNPHALIYSALYFDVGMGATAPPPDVPAGNTGDMWQKLTAFRADVIGETPEHWAIIELRDNAGPGALGSLLTYQHLWRADPPDDRPLRLILVTDLLNPQLAPLLTASAISLVIV